MVISLSKLTIKPCSAVPNATVLYLPSTRPNSPVYPIPLYPFRASACGALPLPSSSLDTALETVSRLGLGQSDIFSTDGGDSTQSSDEGRNGKRDSGMRELLSRGQGPGTNYGAGSQGVCSVPSQGLIAGDGLEKV